jgi:hypothetical protein
VCTSALWKYSLHPAFHPRKGCTGAAWGPPPGPPQAAAFQTCRCGMAPIWQPAIGRTPWGWKEYCVSLTLCDRRSNRSADLASSRMTFLTCFQADDTCSISVVSAGRDTGACCCGDDCLTTSSAHTGGGGAAKLMANQSIQVWADRGLHWAFPWLLAPVRRAPPAAFNLHFAGRALWSRFSSFREPLRGAALSTIEALYIVELLIRLAFQTARLLIHCCRPSSWNMAEQSGDQQQPMQLEAEQVEVGRLSQCQLPVNPARLVNACCDSASRAPLQEHQAAQPSITTAAQALDLNCKVLVDQIYDSASAPPALTAGPWLRLRTRCRIHLTRWGASIAAVPCSSPARLQHCTSGGPGQAPGRWQRQLSPLVCLRRWRPSARTALMRSTGVAGAPLWPGCCPATLSTLESGQITPFTNNGTARPACSALLCTRYLGLPPELYSCTLLHPFFSLDLNQGAARPSSYGRASSGVRTHSSNTAGECFGCRGFRDLPVCLGSEDGPQQGMTPEVLEVLWQASRAGKYRSARCLGDVCGTGISCRNSCKGCGAAPTHESIRSIFLCWCAPQQAELQPALASGAAAPTSGFDLRVSAGGGGGVCLHDA